MKISGISAVVTGGASGLGAATARLLAARGARVVIFDLNEKLGAALAADIGAKFIAVNVTSEDSVNGAFGEVEKDGEAARLLVSCAGIAPPSKAVDRDGRPLPLATFRSVVEVNLVGTFNVVSKFAARAMKLDLDGEERAVVVNTASVAAYEGQIGQAAYSASKSGIVGLTLPLAREFARSAIRVMTIAPGIFITPLLESLPQAAQDSLGQQVPFPSRLGHPDEYARLVEAIVLNPMLNGETIRLDGAIRMAPK